MFVFKCYFWFYFILEYFYLSCICDCFQLQSRQTATINDFFWNGHSVPDIWRTNTGQRTGLHHRIRMPETNLYCIDKLTDQWIKQLTLHFLWFDRVPSIKGGTTHYHSAVFPSGQSTVMLLFFTMARWKTASLQDIDGYTSLVHTSLSWLFISSFSYFFDIFTVASWDQETKVFCTVILTL